MEQQLAEYRARKSREAKIEEIKSKTRGLLNTVWRKSNTTGMSETPLLKEVEEEAQEEVLSVCSETEETVNCLTLTDCLYYLLWFILWVILYAIFIEYQFGTVFLIVSALVFIFFNTRTGPKKLGEVSAYSVFNKNCTSIDGTLKAEQFEREIRYGKL